jgi:hypothetical protein
MYAKKADTSAAITNAECKASSGFRNRLSRSQNGREENKQKAAEHSPPPFTSSTSCTLYNKATLLQRDGKDSRVFISTPPPPSTC